MNDIEELIKRFDRENGNKAFTEKDMLKYLISRTDGIDDKIDKHIISNENRITAIETTISNIKWAFGGIGMALIAIFIKLIV